MDQGAGAFAKSVRPVGIVHEVEGLAQFDEAIDEAFGSLEVDVVVSGAVHDEQVPPKGLRRKTWR